MAKIPRINQGALPSTARVDMPSVAAHPLAAGVDMLGGIAESALEAATVEEIRERKKLAEALAAKQAIVDQSDITRLNLEFENQNFKLIADLEGEFADNPEAMPEEYLKRTREMQMRLKDESYTVANERVRLAAMKNAESTISSGLRAVYSRVSSLQTKKVQDNLTKNEYALINSARDLSGPEQLSALFSRIDENPEYEALYGAKAEEERRDVKSKAAKAQIESLSERQPITARRMLESGKGFYGKFLKPEDFQSLRGKTERDALNRGDVLMLEDMVSFGERGNVLLDLANAGKADAAVIFSQREALEARKRTVIDDVNLLPADRQRRMDLIDREAKFIDAVEQFQTRNTRTEYVSDDETPPEIWRMREKILGPEAELDENTLAGILDYRSRLLKATVDKKMSPGRAATLMKEIALAMPAAIKESQANDGWWVFQNPVEAGTRALKAEIEERTAGEGLPPEVDARATMEYVKAYTRAQAESGEMPSKADMVKMARRAYYLATQRPLPKDLR